MIAKSGSFYDQQFYEIKEEIISAEYLFYIYDISAIRDIIHQLWPMCITFALQKMYRIGSTTLEIKIKYFIRNRLFYPLWKTSVNFWWITWNRGQFYHFGNHDFCNFGVEIFPDKWVMLQEDMRQNSGSKMKWNLGLSCDQGFGEKIKQYEGRNNSFPGVTSFKILEKIFTVYSFLIFFWLCPFWHQNLIRRLVLQELIVLNNKLWMSENVNEKKN